MTSLNRMENLSRPSKKGKRVGRGVGSGVGKTCGRGEKGAGSRAGYKRRYGYEGGQFRTFMKMPIRGFSNARFRKEYETINLSQIDAVYEDGEIVNAETLRERGYLSTRSAQVKVLGNGELTKKVTIDVVCISATAQEKLQKAKIPFTVKK